jgi:hypothetical protein
VFEMASSPEDPEATPRQKSSRHNVKGSYVEKAKNSVAGCDGKGGSGDGSNYISEKTHHIRLRKDWG